MIAIDVEFLTGRFVASSFNDRSRPEWPPHPARLFSALVATLADHPDLADSAGAALDWLATAGDPDIYASPAAARTVMQVYVPDVGYGFTTHSASDDVERAQAALDAAEEAGDRRAARAARKYLDRAREQLRREIEDDLSDNATTIGTAVALLPQRRGRQPRTFPSVTPVVPKVTFLWREALPSDPDRTALALLLARVSRLGHSSSMVACSLAGAPPSDDDLRDRWTPDDRADEVFRVVNAGQRQRLEAAFAGHQGSEPRVLPCRFQRYGGAREASTVPVVTSIFGTDWVVFREVASEQGARRLGLRLTRAPDVARALRATLMPHAGDPPPPLLTGHTPDGTPLSTPHAAFLSLADVGSRWSSGAVLGAAIVLPRDCDPGERAAILRAVGRWEQVAGTGPLPLHLGRNGLLRLERVMDDDPRTTLHPATWCRPAHHWASVTPVALDRNPGDLTARDPETLRAAVETARSIVAASCERIGLPAPLTVEIARRSIFDGAPAARAMMPFPRKEGSIRRVCVHVEIVFPEPVHGPVLLGAGRFQGVGLLRPVTTEAFP